MKIFLGAFFNIDRRKYQTNNFVLQYINNPPQSFPLTRGIRSRPDLHLEPAFQPSNQTQHQQSLPRNAVHRVHHHAEALFQIPRKIEVVHGVPELEHLRGPLPQQGRHNAAPMQEELDLVGISSFST
jgi:hypothetical protein